MAEVAVCMSITPDNNISVLLWHAHCLVVVMFGKSVAKQQNLHWFLHLYIELVLQMEASCSLLLVMVTLSLQLWHSLQQSVLSEMELGYLVAIQLMNQEWLLMRLWRYLVRKWHLIVDETMSYVYVNYTGTVSSPHIPTLTRASGEYASLTLSFQQPLYGHECVTGYGVSGSNIMEQSTTESMLTPGLDLCRMV